MTKNITRTIETTTISTCSIKMIDGVPTVKKESDVTLIGDKLTLEQAKKYVEKKLADTGLIATAVDYTETLYSMPIETFLKYATKKSALTNEQ